MHKKAKTDFSKPDHSPLSQPSHCLPYDVVIRELSTNIDEGLTKEEAQRRLQVYGPNQLEEGEGISIIKILIRQIANAMILVKRFISFSIYFFLTIFDDMVIPQGLMGLWKSDPILCCRFSFLRWLSVLVFSRGLKEV
jgi:magnesium-transporting ATPase (P-type)